MISLGLHKKHCITFPRVAVILGLRKYTVDILIEENRIKVIHFITVGWTVPPKMYAHFLVVHHLKKPVM